MKTLRDYIDLVNERFNQALSEKVTLPADGSAPVTQTVNGVTMNAPANAVKTGSGGVLTTGNGAAVTSGTPAPAPDAAAAAKAKLTPSQLKWLGGADATDSAIMARMPKPQPGEAVPGASPAAAAPATMSAADQEDADMGAAMKANQAAAISANQDAEDLAMGQAMTANAQAATQAANGVNAAGQNVTMPGGINPETGEPTTVTAGAPAVAQSAQAAPAAGGKVPPQPTLSGKPSTGPKGQAWLQKYGATHNPDGSPKAAGAPAAQKPGLDASGRANAAADPRVAGNNTPKPGTVPGMGQKGPTVAAAQGKDPSNPLNQAPVAKEGRTARNDHAFIDELNAMRSIAGLPTKNKW